MNAIDVAIKMKSDAVKFYGKAADECSHPIGRKMLLAVLEDEQHHLEHLKELVNEMKVDIKKLKPIKNVKAVLETMKDQMRVRTACSLDDVETFRIAMDMEKECVEFYKKQAANARNKTEKDLFERLAIEEEEHYRVFSNTYSFLDDTGNWFMWEEHSIVEG